MPKAKAASDPVGGRIVDSGRKIHSRSVGGRKPSMKVPLRSLWNVRYTSGKGYFEMGVRAEQQAFAKSDLNFVVDRSLLEKPKQTGNFLP